MTTEYIACGPRGDDLMGTLVAETCAKAGVDPNAVTLTDITLLMPGGRWIEGTDKRLKELARYADGLIIFHPDLPENQALVRYFKGPRASR